MFAPSGSAGWLAITSGGMSTNHTLQLWRTLDGGVRWTLVSNLNPTDFLLGFQNFQNGWASGVHNGGAPAAWLAGPGHSSSQIAPPVLYRTTDGGHTWEPQYLPVPSALIQHSGIVSLGDMTWFGDNGYLPVSFTSDQLPYMKWGLYVTKNGGQTWHFYMDRSVDNNYGSYLTQVSLNVVSPNDLWETVMTERQSGDGPYQPLAMHLYHESAPDKAWIRVGVTPVPFVQVQFVSGKVGFAFTQEGTLYETLDGGANWRAKVNSW